MELFVTAVTIGLVGSFHCIGMCGPIAFALPIKSNTLYHRIISGVLYNSGRLTTYILFGLLFGIIGQGISTASTQQTISIILGVIFILSVIIPKSIINKISPTNTIGFYISKVKNGLGKLLKSSSTSNLLLIGLLNGLLPCGLVYAAIGGSIATGNTTDGALFMLAFGLGTLPMMFSAVLLSNFISLKFRNRIRKVIPVFIVLLGCLFIVRGLNLNIPYLSPKINVERPFIQDCAN
ncbi:MAG: sulfite exporter TauE/SafE family protein [Flavobacteriales bacterium]|nr:sulfite exporter TauE/SafE family protein [Flavobacteriales bacterium]